jgi:acetaldehyde dehydrogenase
MSQPKTKVAIIGSGNIGTDLMIKILQTSKTLEMSVLVGIDENSDGLARARTMGVATTYEGIDGLVKMPEFAEIAIVFDATSAAAHQHHHSLLQQHDKQVIDLTPAAVGPYTVPVVNLDEHLQAPNVNMVTCGGQATIPIVAAVGKVHPVIYAEIVSSISSRSAGPGTRANIDEFTVTTARAIESVGGATHGKAIIVLNPADPPLLMRNTVLCLVEGDANQQSIVDSVNQMVADVQAYVPGYRLKQDVQFDSVSNLTDPRVASVKTGTRVTVFLEVAGAAHYLPEYAGNLDIMTSAAMKTAERLIELRGSKVGA